MILREKWLTAIFAVLVVIAIFLFANLVVLGGTNFMRGMPMMGANSATISSSNGEQIFRTGTNARGEAIPNSMMTGMGGCAMCHGANGQGGQMMGRAEPCNTYKCLSAERYTDDLIKRAVTQGIGADGRKLDLMMPRWQISDSDVNDVIQYLKTLP